MRIIAKRTLREFWETPGREDSQSPLDNWYRTVSPCNWTNFADVKALYPSCDHVGNDRLVFNIGGNKYRLVVRVDFRKRTLYIRFVGTHEEDDKVKVSEI